MIHKFVNRFIEIVKDLGSKSWIFYGKDNLLPNKLIKWVNESGTAKLALNKYAQYIDADGFVDERTALTHFNDYQNGDQLLSDISIQQAYFKGFVLFIQRDGFNKIKSTKVIPLDKCRKDKEKDIIWYNPTLFTSKFQEIKWKSYPIFKKENRYIDAQEGEIAYFYKKSADNPYYPVPDYYAGIEDIITSSELSKMDLEITWNGFLTSGSMTFIGNPNKVIDDQNNRTYKDYIDAQLQEFTGAKKDGDGLSTRFSLLTFWAGSKEEAPIYQPFDSKGIIEASNTKRDLIDRIVCRLMKVHPVLIGFSDATILGNQQALSNAQKELINTVNTDQRFISASLKTIYPDLDFNISQIQPAFVSDANVISKLTEEEIRNIFFGLEPIERQLPTEGKKILQTLSTLSPLLATKIIELIPKQQLLDALGIKTDANVNQQV
jgi:hypothetical protein